MSSEDFWDETPCEFALRLFGHRQRQEQVDRAEWERARLVAYYSVAAHLKKQTTVQSFMPDRVLRNQNNEWKTAKTIN